ncbi:MAG: prolipoprotein diacylglyceryl transferase [Firmicutes bacterium]|nr:prolipoprotein diacylglyceryl transferase [Bacillota bacterium]
MFPNILGISSYTFFAALGFASFILVFILSLDIKLKVGKNELLGAVVIMILAMGLGLLFAWILDGLFKIPDRGGLVLWQRTNAGLQLTGITWYGMLIGSLSSLALLHYLANLIFVKKKGKPLLENNRRTYLNTAAPSMALAHFWGRIGCFAAGCCYGVVSNFLGVVYPNRTHGAYPRFAVQLVEAGILLAIFLVLMLVKNKKVQDNRLFIYLGVYAVARFVLEFFRDDFRGGLFAFMGLSPAQFVSICLIIFVVCMLILDNAGKRQKNMVIKEEDS